jgi:GT2 family glycosyltransferase
MLNHMKIGKQLSSMHGSRVEPLNTTIAGFFMLFSVDIWRKAGGFREGKIRMDLDGNDYMKHKSKDKFFDWHFCNDAIKAGGKIGIARGIYVFHLYRPWSNNPKRATEHLR